jgi:hypothetical protein
MSELTLGDSCVQVELEEDASDSQLHILLRWKKLLEVGPGLMAIVGWDACLTAGNMPIPGCGVQAGSSPDRSELDRLNQDVKHCAGN